MENYEFPSYKTIFLILAGCFLLGLGLDWGSTGNQFFLYKFFAPKQEAARREVYEHTKSYHQGSIQRLNTLCGQVSMADPDHKIMIYDVINQEFAEWDTADVPEYLQSCLDIARNR